MRKAKFFLKHFRRFVNRIVELKKSGIPKEKWEIEMSLDELREAAWVGVSEIGGMKLVNTTAFPPHKVRIE